MNTVILANRPLSLLSVLKSSFATFPINLPISPRIFLLFRKPRSPGSRIHAIATDGKSWNGLKSNVHI
ncbi:hypothetical protein ES332_A03G160200v1 [Gossypium tomentosum]|uniref:Uncharacterized protein n=1 Tax=Gossypium tomentosum TaxID=34277 RepID=A0A5D2R8S4_GOSTO|nr:hypothetical protein ES332_A03G160200v1 [Gossypium tomentosum]